LKAGMTVPAEILGLWVEDAHTLMDLFEACSIFSAVTFFVARQYILADRT
jgi:hypothetical protein